MFSWDAWDSHKQSTTYRIYDCLQDGRWIARYTVTGPGGKIIACTTTMWGAKRAIKKWKGEPKKFWEQPFTTWP